LPGEATTPANENDPVVKLYDGLLQKRKPATAPAENKPAVGSPTGNR
jgi:hypothetical protein